MPRTQREINAAKILRLHLHRQRLELREVAMGKKFAAAVETERLVRGWTLGRLARAAGINKTTLHYLLNGRKWWNMQEVRRVVDALKS